MPPSRVEEAAASSTGNATQLGSHGLTVHGVAASPWMAPASAPGVTHTLAPSHTRGGAQLSGSGAFVTATHAPVPRSTSGTCRCTPRRSRRRPSRGRSAQSVASVQSAPGSAPRSSALDSSPPPAFWPPVRRIVPVGEARSRVVDARGPESAEGRERAGGRVVALRGRAHAAAPHASRHDDLARGSVRATW